MTSVSDIYDVHILLVDDDDFMRRVIRQVMAGLGYRNITEEGDGSGAEQRLRALRYDLVITDVQMPEMNGLELLKRIRCGRTGASYDSKVVIITSFSNTEVLSAAIALDVNGFLVKPMKPATVQKKINQAIEEHFNPRPTQVYEEVITDLASIMKPESARIPNAGIVMNEQAGALAASSSTNHTDANLVSVFDLKSGMVLCEDLRLKDGTLILSHTHTLSETTVNRLIELRNLLQDELVWVRAANQSV